MRHIISDINYIILNFDELDENIFQNIGKSISKGYDNTKEFISDSADNIKEKFHYIHQNLLTLVTKNKHSISHVENKLKDSGVDVLKLKSLATEESKKVLFKIKKDEFNIFTFVKLVGNSFNNAFNKCLPKKNSIGRQAIVGITLLAFALFMNAALHIAFYLLFGPEIGDILTGCLAAPFTEELGKIISINQDAGGAYFLIFNAAEWTLYVKRIMAITTGFSTFMTIAIIRTICAYIHYLWSRIHAASSKTAESREEGMKLGMLFHCLHNFFTSTPLGLLYLPINLVLTYQHVKKIENKNNQKKFGINKLVKLIA